MLIVLGGLGGLVMLEPDLDSAIVLALIGFALLIVAGVRCSTSTVARDAGVGLVTAPRVRGALPPGAHARVHASVDRPGATPATRSRSR